MTFVLTDQNHVLPDCPMYPSVPILGNLMVLAVLLSPLSRLVRFWHSYPFCELQNRRINTEVTLDWSR